MMKKPDVISFFFTCSNISSIRSHDIAPYLVMISMVLFLNTGGSTRTIQFRETDTFFWKRETRNGGFWKI